MSRREANLLTALLLFLFALTLAFTAPRWARSLREPVASTEEDLQAGPSVGGVRADDEVEAQRSINVKLYFPDTEAGGLLYEEREVPFSSDLQRQLRNVVEELVKGPRTGLLAPFVPETRVLEVFVTARGVAYVDLSKEAQALPGAGSQGELLSVYSLVNSVVANFPAVKRVQILVEDKPVMTLGGHVDLSRPLPPDMTFLVQPKPSPEAEATGAPAPPS